MNDIVAAYQQATPSSGDTVHLVTGNTIQGLVDAYFDGEWTLKVNGTTVWTKTNGWQNLDGNGEIAVSDTVKDVASSYGADPNGGNGVIWGKV